MGDVNRDYHRRVRPTPTDATAASLVLRDGRASVSSGEPFTPPMATRTDTAWKRDDATRGRRLSYGRDAPTSF
jgi:hypothetical protein